MTWNYRWRSMIAWISQFHEFAKRLFTWLPILWRDRDFDYAYAYRILGFKFSLMAERFEKHGACLSSGRTAKELRIAADLCRRIANEGYGDPTIGPWLDVRGKLVYHGHNKAPWLYDIYMKKQDIDSLHALMARKIRGWWD